MKKNECRSVQARYTNWEIILRPAPVTGTKVAVMAPPEKITAMGIRKWSSSSETRMTTSTNKITGGTIVNGVK